MAKSRNSGRFIVLRGSFDVYVSPPHLHRHGLLLEQPDEHHRRNLDRRYRLDPLIHAQAPRLLENTVPPLDMATPSNVLYHPGRNLKGLLSRRRLLRPMSVFEFRFGLTFKNSRTVAYNDIRDQYGL